MAKASREFVYGLNPAFEVLRAGKRRVFAAHLNEGMRENSRVKKLVSLLERNEVESKLNITNQQLRVVDEQMVLGRQILDAIR